MKKVFMGMGLFVLLSVLTIGLSNGLQSNPSKDFQGDLAQVKIYRECTRCKGTGKITIKKKCYTCPGGVEIIEMECSTCNGTGKIQVK